MLILLPIPMLFFSCNTNMEENNIEKWKSEIIETEQEFVEMVQKDGIPKAFLNYAADDAVLMRNNSLIIGKEALRESYKNRKQENGKVNLTWEPDFVDVALSGDLGYTYGKYVYTTTDSIGQTKKAEGIFHTVWKRQPDGKWRFVWD